MDKNEIIRRLRHIADKAVHVKGETPYIMSIDEGIALHEAIRIINNLSALMNEGWTPTKERTPTERGKYLCCGPRAVYIAELLDTEKVEWYVNTRDYPPHPIAWMPVPEVYKED